MAAGGEDDDEFVQLLDRYLDPPAEPNRSMEATEIVWVEGDERLGAAHIDRHGISKYEVEEVLLEIPPYVKRSGRPISLSEHCFGARPDTIAGSSSCVRTGARAAFAT